MKNEYKDVKTWTQVAVVFLLRVVDAALLPWLVAALFILGMVWLFTRNLSSPDTLAFMTRMTGLKGLAWAGWGLFTIAIPAFRAIYKQGSKNKDARIRELEEENDKARKLLSKFKVNELELTQGSESGPGALQQMKRREEKL